MTVIIMQLLPAFISLAVASMTDPSAGWVQVALV